MKRTLIVAAIIAALLIPGAVDAEPVRSDWPRSDALVFFNTHNSRYLQAIGGDVIQSVQPFVTLPVDSVTGTPTEWTLTVINADTAALTTVAGGALLLTTDAAENDGPSIQLKGEAFQMTADSPLYFGIKLQISDATDSDFVVGLCITDTTLLAGMTYGIYFRNVDGSLNVATVTEAATVEEENLAMGVLVNATDITLEFIAESTGNVKFFIDGALVATHSTTLPTAEVLTLSIEFLNGAIGAETMTVDWIRVIQLR